MSLVYCGACSHAPGITGRAERADTQSRQALHGALHRMGDDIRATKPDALVVVAAEHFANFFMNNMPAFAIGMADSYEGPIEDEAFLRIKRTKVPGDKALSKKLIEGVMQTVDVAYAEEWKFDHGIAVPLNFLTPNYDLPIIPANINCQGPPLPPPTRCRSASLLWQPAASRIGRPRPTRERSTRNGTASFSRAGPRTTARRCCRTPTPTSIATAGRAASKSAPSLPRRQRQRVPRARSSSASPCRSSP